MGVFLAEWSSLSACTRMVKSHQLPFCGSAFNLLRIARRRCLCGGAARHQRRPLCPVMRGTIYALAKFGVPVGSTAMTSADRQWWRRYDRYLNSQGWKLTREACLRRDGYRCRRCGLAGLPSNPLQADHLTYENYNRTGQTPRRSPHALPPLPRNYYWPKIPPARLQPLAVAMVVAAHAQAKGRAGDGGLARP